MKSKTICNLYISFWCLYNLQGTLYETGSILSRVLLGILLIVSLYYYALVSFTFYIPKSLKLLSVLIAIWTVYGVFRLLFGGGTGGIIDAAQPFEYIKAIYISLLPIYVFYYFSRKGIITEKYLFWWFFAFLIVALSDYYENKQRELEFLAQIGSSREEITNNAGYIILSLFPLLSLFQKKPVVQYSILGVCMWLILMGFKRGAIIAAIICAVWMIYQSLKEESKIKKKSYRRIFTRVLLTVGIIFVAIYAVQYVMQTSDFFVLRLDATREGDSSNRDYLYGMMYNYLVNEQNAFTLLFGNGADATLRIFSVYAHNDWLEIAVDNGLIVVLLYLFYWISLIKLFINGKKPSMPAMMLGMFVIIYLFKTMFSMSYNSIPMYATCALGYALANIEIKSKLHE